jgi:hypothetical protein
MLFKVKTKGFVIVKGGAAAQVSRSVTRRAKINNDNYFHLIIACAIQYS